MIHKDLQVSLLPATLIIKNHVHGEEDANYENYMLELVNHSSFFMKKSDVPFVKPISESHGECDAYSPLYQMDFKLLASKTACQARSIFSLQIDKTSQGVLIYRASKETGEMLATNIHAAFREKSMGELESIRTCAPQKNGVDNDIYCVLTNLEMQKNLLFFFPYRLAFANGFEPSIEEAALIIGEALDNDFHVAFFEYRNKYAKEFDTHLVCIFNDLFLIFTIAEDKIRFVESVKSSEISVYIKLKNYGDGLFDR